jgi:hypothetical protein
MCEHITKIKLVDIGRDIMDGKPIFILPQILQSPSRQVIQTGKQNPCCQVSTGQDAPMNSKMRHSLPLRVTLSTTLRENTELGIAKISRSKLRMVVRYHPTSSTMPSTGYNKPMPDIMTSLA